MRLLNINREVRDGKSVYRLQFVHAGRLFKKFAAVSDCAMSVSSNIRLARARALQRVLDEAELDCGLMSGYPRLQYELKLVSQAIDADPAG